MTHSLVRRLNALEIGGAAWRAYSGKPVEEWPDEALIAFLNETLPGPAPGIWTDEMLERVAKS